jgi:hypothetical protein
MKHEQSRNKDTATTPGSLLLYWAFYNTTARSSRGNQGINREGGGVPWRKTTTPGFTLCPFLYGSPLSPLTASLRVSPRLKRGCRKKSEQFHAAGSWGNKKRDSKLRLLLQTRSQYSLCTSQYSVYTSYMTVKTVSTLVNCNKYITVKCSLVEVDQHFRLAYCLHALTIGAVGITETSAYFETVERYSPEGCQLDTRRRQNPKSHIYFILLTHTHVPTRVVLKHLRDLFPKVRDLFPHSHKITAELFYISWSPAFWKVHGMTRVTEQKRKKIQNFKF